MWMHLQAEPRDWACNPTRSDDERPVGTIPWVIRRDLKVMDGWKDILRSDHEGKMRVSFSLRRCTRSFSSRDSSTSLLSGSYYSTVKRFGFVR
jgi:hypothetical protein